METCANDISTNVVLLMKLPRSKRRTAGFGRQSHRLRQHSQLTRPLSRIFFIIRLAEQIFRLIFGLAEFLRKLQNSAENTAEQYKFG